MKTNKHIDLNAEAAILSAMLNDPRVVPSVVSSISEEHFYRTAHKVLLGEMSKMFKAGTAIDPITLINKLSEDKKLDSIGGMLFIDELSDVVLSGANVKDHIAIVKSKAKARKLEATISSMQASLNSGQDVKLLIDEVQEAVLSITADEDRSASKSIQELSMETVDRKEKILAGTIKEPKYITGLSDLDYGVDIAPGKLVLIDARSGSGKTVLGQQIAFLNMKAGARVANFNMEMEDNELMDRGLAQEGMKHRQIKKMHDVNEFVLTKIMNSLENFSEMQMEIDTSPALSSMQISARLQQMRHKMKGLDIGIVDYIQLMRNPNAKSKREMLEEISGDLKKIAKKEKIPICILGQLNKDYKIRDAEGIWMDSDVEIQIRRPLEEGMDKVKWKGKLIRVTSKNFTIVKVNKNRGGETFVFLAWFDGDHQKFVDWDGQMPLLEAEENKGWRS